VSETMANRRLIARHATWADRYRTGTAWSFSPRHHLHASAHGHHRAGRRAMRTTTVSHRHGQDHRRATSSWFEGADCWCRC